MAKSATRLDLMLGNDCNTNCSFCYLNGMDRKRYGRKSDYSLWAIKKAILLGKKKGFNEAYLSGGEPTLRDDLPLIIAFARRNGYARLKLLTNGLRLSYRKYLNALVGAGLTGIAFSLHGADSEVHDSHTGYKGSFRLICAAIDNALRHRDKIEVELNSVVTRQNIKGMAEICRFAERRGIKRLHFQLVVPNSVRNRKLYPEKRDIKHYFQGIASQYRDRLPGLTFGFVPLNFLGRYRSMAVALDINAGFVSNSPSMFREWKKSLISKSIKMNP